MLLDDLVKLTERHRLACRFYRDYTDSMLQTTPRPPRLPTCPIFRFALSSSSI